MTYEVALKVWNLIDAYANARLARADNQNDAMCTAMALADIENELDDFIWEHC